MRIVVWVIVALMIIGMVIPSLTWIFTLDVSAAYDTNTDDTIVRIGLLYGTSVVPAFQTRSPYGFRVCSVDKETDEVTELYPLSGTTTLEATVEKNLIVKGGDYIPTDQSECDIGAYHAMLETPLSLGEVYMAMYAAIGNGYNEPMIASYSNGAYFLLVGSFGDADSAQAYIDNAGNIFEGFTVNGENADTMIVCEPSPTAVNLIDYDTNMIVFRYDGGETEELGVMANDAQDGTTAYLQTPANKLYDGVFLFTRHESGIELVNLIGLEDYVMGVLPYEISNSWPLETQKAFAVAVRSYTANTSGKHTKTYGFDMCNTVCCQAYHGVRNINDTVRQAVAETSGQVLVSREGEIITTYYSAVAGGTTVSAKQAWGGSGASYLVARSTPWEDYSWHTNGTWKWSVSPSDLRDVLVSKGYTDITGPIADIELEYAENSGYVYAITFEDVNSNKVTIKNTDTVRSRLSSYIKSSNFVVGRGSVLINDPAFGSESAKRLFSRLGRNNKISYVNWTEPIKVESASGEKYTWAGVDTPVLTSSGEVSYVDRTVEIKADNSDHFLFVGRGWGHGVGLSQVGAYCLGIQGFDMAFILRAYFSDTHLEDYSKILAGEQGEKNTDEDAELGDTESVEDTVLDEVNAEDEDKDRDGDEDISETEDETEDTTEDEDDGWKE